jgi:hypothetical protein
VISFPDSGTSQNWAPPVDQFAVAVADALAGIVGPADVSPQVFVIDSYNPGTNISVPNLSFSTTTVRAAFIKYALYRTTSSTSAYEAGTLTAVYNTAGGVWDLGQQFVGNGQFSFTMTNVGQIQITTNTLAGINHQGKLGYSATALLNT